MAVEEKFSIVPVLTCVEATEIWDLLPPREELTDKDGLALAMVEKHRREVETHESDCFTQRQIN